MTRKTHIPTPIKVMKKTPIKKNIFQLSELQCPSVGGGPRSLFDHGYSKFKHSRFTQRKKFKVSNVHGSHFQLV